jgi:hypothetical protein
VKEFLSLVHYVLWREKLYAASAKPKVLGKPKTSEIGEVAKKAAIDKVAAAYLSAAINFIFTLNIRESSPAALNNAVTSLTAAAAKINDSSDLNDIQTIIDEHSQVKILANMAKPNTRGVITYSPLPIAELLAGIAVAPNAEAGGMVMAKSAARTDYDEDGLDD